MSIFNEEQELFKQGYNLVAGLDEVGRGPLAGPVIAAVVVLLWSPSSDLIKTFEKLKDSKKLSAELREKWYKILVSRSDICWAVAGVSEKMIDKINIFEAVKLAMIKAIKKLKVEPDFLLLDGNMKLDLAIPQKAIIKGDEKVFSCMAASVIAKVIRDRLMIAYHKKYPVYGFDKHKGYGTKKHFVALAKYGQSIIHRQSFLKS